MNDYLYRLTGPEVLYLLFLGSFLRDIARGLHPFYFIACLGAGLEVAIIAGPWALVELLCFCLTLLVIALNHYRRVQP